VKDGADQGRRRLARERPGARRHLVQDQAEGEHVRARVHRLPLELLWRHVVQRSENLAFAGERRGGLGAAIHHARLERRLGQAEVQQLGPAPGQHDVGRLQVAMDDAAPMRGGEPFGDLRRTSERLVQGQGPAPEPCGKRLAVEQLPDQVLDAVLPSDVVERADVRV
jgi:hypothetical protein